MNLPEISQELRNCNFCKYRNAPCRKISELCKEYENFTPHPDLLAYARACYEAGKQEINERKLPERVFCKSINKKCPYHLGSWTEWCYSCPDYQKSQKQDAKPF